MEAEKKVETTKAESKKTKATKAKSEKVEETNAESVVESTASEPENSGRIVKGMSGKTVMAVDAETGLQVETDAEREKRELLNLQQSLRFAKVLKGTMTGIEKTSEGSVALIFYGSFKVIIKVSDLLPNFNPSGKIRTEAAYDAAITNHIGAELDFIVKAIDEENRLVVASRSEAMAVKRKLFDNKDTNGFYIFCKDTKHEARIVSVVKPGVFVELNGIETFIPSYEVSWNRIDDATTLGGELINGNTVMVCITDITRDQKTGEVTDISLSIKRATDNPMIREFAQINVGSVMAGRVQYINDQASIFVGIANHSQVKCAPLRSRAIPAIGARVFVLIKSKSESDHKIWGRIVKC